MNENLNLVEILKDCPKGTKLYSPALGECTLEEINKDKTFPIRIKYKAGDNTYSEIFTEKGYLHTNTPNAECMLFPSKGQRDWSKWQRPFVDGDIVTDIEGAIIIYQEITTSGYCGSFASLDHRNQFIPHYKAYLDCIRLSTEEEKEKLFQAIKDNGYEWNSKTKTLEKLIVPKFKVGDKIRHKTANIDYVLEISRVYNDSYGIVGCGWMVSMEYQNEYELVPNKFDVTTLKPFDKVLVRDNDTSIWVNAFFGFYDIVITKKYPFVASGINWTQCIPYEGNEHLLGKYEDCDEYYKNW